MAGESGAIQAIVLVGSLVTDSYVPGPGDIDQITILRDSAPSNAEQRLHNLMEGTMRAFDRAVNLAPVVYRRANLDRPWATEWDLAYETKHRVCVPEELLRIHDHGRVLYGPGFRIADLPRPTREEMVAYQERCRRWNQEFSRRNPALDIWNLSLVPVRIAVQIILSRAMWHYYFATAQCCFNKHRVGERLRRDVPGYQFLDLVELATKARVSGFAVSGQDGKLLSQGCRDMRTWEWTLPPGAVPETRRP